MSAVYDSSSPYYQTDLKQGYLDVVNFRNIVSQKDDITYEVDPKYEFRPDLLAYDFYGDVKLWWVFAVRNKDIISDPVFDLVAGLSIRVPSPSNLKTSLGI